ncbi:bifunctional cobalt-precorrin-7 (C(5))-methyltransferase/cobalt-precorrin-6B (C(15))-methyltransferase [Nonomuraea aurantiaca]|uniref:bifunctional cobalt-precorrin-7 (C(5))-methyltransferase/cobalt-precorrin-6B (C(15))-methyltransferase n=1 Tax=Nonomuraea aurantiaca TaxID=2878562 RepID=UPI001CD9E9CF|nr:bifunctional cobalt-precorrin-7 (C(5))-methyltransferase CbiE/decarboxylating cobalt-precorrin-6B (C(15))-methyltransferase CbiT [Nonomuraea aurantiaca]MCA2223410.1 cobalamin biosynthesis bifunctional protein CbiET [Nonomuraea aurantiaca]
MITVVGWDGSELSARAVERLRGATLVVGPDAIIGQLRLTASVVADGSLLQTLDNHLEQGEGAAVVVAEGDPGFFGVVRRLRAHGLKPDVLPATSLVTRAFACAGLNWEDALVVAPAGPHQLNRVVNACRAHPKVALLVAPGVGPGDIARELAPTTPRELIVCEDIGGPDERVTHSRMGEATTRPWKDPDVVLVIDPLHQTREPGWVAGAQPGPAEWALPFASSMPAEVRAYILAKLGPRLGDLVWDVGAGSGEIAVECARLGAAVVAVERDEAACARLRASVLEHGVKVALARGQAPPALEPLPDPDAVFVGGGGADVIVACAARRPRTLVCALKTVERVSAVLDRLREHGYRAEGTQIIASKLTIQPDGSHSLAAADPVFVVHATPSRVA